MRRKRHGDGAEKEVGIAGGVCGLTHSWRSAQDVRTSQHQCNLSPEGKSSYIQE